MEENFTIEFFPKSWETPPYVMKHISPETEEDPTEKVRETLHKVIRSAGLPAEPTIKEQRELLNNDEKCKSPEFFLIYSKDPRGNAKESEKNFITMPKSVIQYWLERSGAVDTDEDSIRELVKECIEGYRENHEDDVGV